MNAKRVLLVCLILAMFIISACAIPPAPPSKDSGAKPASSSENTTSPESQQSQKTQNPDVYKLEYCRDAIKSSTKSVNSAKSKIENKEEDIKEINKDIEAATKAKDSQTETEKKKELEVEKKVLSELESKLSKAQSDLSNTKAKCDKLDRSKDSSICQEFLGDMEIDLKDTNSNLAKVQSDLTDYQKLYDDAKAESKPVSVTKAIQDEISDAKKDEKTYKVMIENLNRKKTELDEYC